MAYTPRELGVALRSCTALECWDRMEEGSAGPSGLTRPAPHVALQTPEAGALGLLFLLAGPLQWATRGSPWGRFPRRACAGVVTRDLSPSQPHSLG